MPKWDNAPASENPFYSYPEKYGLIIHPNRRAYAQKHIFVQHNKQTGFWEVAYFKTLMGVSIRDAEVLATASSEEQARDWAWDYAVRVETEVEA